MSIYKDAKLVLANRFHANVCSIGMQIPTVGLVNYRQIKKLYEELKSKNYVDISQQDFSKGLMQKIQNYENDIELFKIEKKYKNYINNLYKWIKNKELL